MFALQQLRASVSRNSAAFQTVRGHAKKAAAPSAKAAASAAPESHGQQWAVKVMAQAAEINSSQAEKALKALLSGIEASVVKGEKVSFKVRSHKKRKKKVELPPVTVVAASILFFSSARENAVVNLMRK